MGSRAIYLRVGLLVVVGIAAVVGLVLFLGGETLQNATAMETCSSESVQGLNVGAPVSCLGVTVGRVTNIGLGSAGYFRNAPANLRRATCRMVVERFVVSANRVGRTLTAERIAEAVTVGFRTPLATQGITGVIPADADVDSLEGNRNDIVIPGEGRASTSFHRDIKAVDGGHKPGDDSLPASLEGSSNTSAGMSCLALDFVNPRRFPPLAVPSAPRYPYVPSAPSTFSRVQSAAEQLASQLKNIDFRDIATALLGLIQQLQQELKGAETHQALAAMRTLVTRLNEAVDQADLPGLAAAIRQDRAARPRYAGTLPQLRPRQQRNPPFADAAGPAPQLT